MPTLLVTRKMSPALAARVAASVNGRRALSGATLAPRSLSLLRLVAFGTIVAALVWFVQHRARVQRQLEEARATALERFRREAGALTPEQRALALRVQPWLERDAGPYAGDWVDDDVKGRGALAAILTRGAVYVRGPLASFTSAAGVADSARSSFKDALVLCLVDPPAARTEKLLLGKARVAYANGRRMREQTAQIERLHDAIAGLPFLGPKWEARIRAAADERELGQVRQLFERAPLSAAKRAAKAALLLFAMDEPSTGRGPTELDGERARFVRVGLIDLAFQKPLLRLRRSVDPSWLSSNARSEYAMGIDGCTLAVDVHAAVSDTRLSTRVESAR